MAPPAFWKGYLKLSLVTCRVTLVPATTEAEKLRFHTMNAKTGNRVVSRYVDAETGKPVAEKDEVKGYARAEGDYVLLEDDEIEAVALDSARTIEIDMFVPEDSIAWIWRDRPHYLLPADEVGQEAFSVIRDAMAATGMVGISRLVLYRRERAVMLVPRDKGIVLWTLRYGDEVRPPDEIFEAIDPGKPDAAQLKLIARLIKDRTAPWTPEMVHDPVQQALQDIITAKKRGRRKAAPAGKTPDRTKDNVIDIMEALKKSLAAEKGGGKR